MPLEDGIKPPAWTMTQPSLEASCTSSLIASNRALGGGLAFASFDFTMDINRIVVSPLFNSDWLETIAAWRDPSRESGRSLRSRRNLRARTFGGLRSHIPFRRSRDWESAWSIRALPPAISPG